MQGNKLARVHWRMGQTLLPSHFVAQEDSLLANLGLRFSLTGLPNYGLARLRWNESLLAEGILNIQSLTVVLPGGELIDIPGNATTTPFNMNETGQARLSIFFHLMGEKELDDGGSSSDGAVRRKVFEVALNSEESLSAAKQTFGLADFNKDLEGNWALSPDYVPALVQMGTTPFLMPLIEELDKQLENFHFKLAQQIAASHLSGESLSSSKKILHAVYTMQSFLQDLQGQVRFHPYFAFAAIKAFYLELCFFQNVTPEHVKTGYQHGDLASCFQALSEPTIQMLKQVKADNPYIPFEFKGESFRISRLPEKVSSAAQVFLLVQKERVGDKIAIDAIKLASIARLPTVHQLSLGGVPLEKIARPPFQHSFGPEVEFYRIVGGEEWDYALRDMTLAFYALTEHKGLKAYIYWRES